MIEKPYSRQVYVIGINLWLIGIFGFNLLTLACLCAQAYGFL